MGTTALLRALRLSVCLLAAAIVPSAAAQDYPARPVKILIAFAPGGPTDIVGRLLAQKLSENFGDKPFLIENRPGAGGNIGITQVARAAPDGYTLLLVSSAFVINPSLYANAGFDAIRDFTPVTLAVTSPNVLVTHPSFPARDMKELRDRLVAQGFIIVASTPAETAQKVRAEVDKWARVIKVANIKPE